MKTAQTWSKNPKFLLTVFPKEGEKIIRFRVCISRPQEKWAKILERNKVGSMLGL